MLLKVTIDDVWLHYPIFQSNSRKKFSHTQKILEIPVVEIFYYQQQYFVVSHVLEVINWYLQGNKNLLGVTIEEDKLFAVYCTTPKFLKPTSCHISDLIS